MMTKVRKELSNSNTGWECWRYGKYNILSNYYPDFTISNTQYLDTTEQNGLA
ncbi:MAG: hypothetical protein L0H53_14350 [Candidatus Nitrosocosmicus sp.]|nr:hypothetical protein [Candidatus Nitrosocosmicus sp.]MDN5866177.1 hypothetical protein [Candidatus Nitrosocosmicus sp.]